jgi:hypothetical protein
MSKKWRSLSELVDRFEQQRQYIAPALRYECRICGAERVLPSASAPTGLLHCGRWAYAVPCDLPVEGDAA